MLLYTALRNLTRNIRRTTAILITVALGTGSLFIFHGFNAGIMNQYRDNTVHSRFGHGQLNTSGYREQVYEKPWEHWIENAKEVTNEIKTYPGVTHVFPRVEFFALLTNGRVTVSGQGQGIDGEQEADFFRTLNIIEGETLSTQEDGVILGRGLARTLDLSPGDRLTVLGNTVDGSMNGVDLTVTGIFHTGSKAFDDRVFRLPLKQALILLDTPKIESIAIGLDSVESWPAFEKRVEERFPTLEATEFAILDKVYYQHSVDWLNSQFGVIQGIILAVVLLGIFNTVSSGILERKQEIGNLRANGESIWEVMQLLTLEGILMGIIGASVGIVLVLLLNSTVLAGGLLMPPAPGLTRQYYVMIELQPNMALLTFAMGVATSLVGTLIAGIRTARMPIGEALRAT